MSTVRYKAITPAKNEEGTRTYKGRTLGVKFDEGVAFFDDVTVKNKSLGLDAETIARRMEQDFGYTVERMNPDGTPYIDVADAPEIPTPAPKSTRTKDKATS